MRKSRITRKTNETDISLSIDIDGKGVYSIDTGIGFFNHMLELFSKHSLIDVELVVKGDTHVDFHHTVEDTAIVLGNAIKQALGNKEGIARYGFASIPMDESLTNVSIDLSGRAYPVFNCPVEGGKTGDFDFELVEEFITAFAHAIGANVHVNVMYGSNRHHISEGVFKALAKSLRVAASVDEKQTGIPSTKGII